MHEISGSGVQRINRRRRPADHSSVFEINPGTAVVPGIIGFVRRITIFGTNFVLGSANGESRGLCATRINVASCLQRVFGRRLPAGNETVLKVHPSGMVVPNVLFGLRRYALNGVDVTNFGPKSEIPIIMGSQIRVVDSQTRGPHRASLAMLALRHLQCDQRDIRREHNGADYAPDRPWSPQPDSKLLAKRWPDSFAARVCSDSRVLEDGPRISTGDRCCSQRQTTMPTMVSGQFAVCLVNCLTLIFGLLAAMMVRILLTTIRVPDSNLFAIGGSQFVPTGIGSDAEHAILIEEFAIHKSEGLSRRLQRLFFLSGGCNSVGGLLVPTDTVGTNRSFRALFDAYIVLAAIRGANLVRRWPGAFWADFAVPAARSKPNVPRKIQ